MDPYQQLSLLRTIYVLELTSMDAKIAHTYGSGTPATTLLSKFSSLPMG